MAVGQKTTDQIRESVALNANELLLLFPFPEEGRAFLQLNVHL